MRNGIAALGLLGWLSVGSHATAQPSIFFEENFDGPLVSSIWRTEIITRGPRWCSAVPGDWWGSGHWVEEGSPCYGVPAYSDYGNMAFSGGAVYFTSHNEYACFYLASRLPGPVPLFPSASDFKLRMRLRYTHVTPWPAFVTVVQTQSTEPSGVDPVALPQGVLMSIGANSDSWDIRSALDGSFGQVALVPSTVYELHEFVLDCVGTSFTIGLDGQVIYGPVTSALRPTAVWMGNPARSDDYLTNWEWFSVDYVRVEVQGAVSVAEGTWGALKATYRD